MLRVGQMMLAQVFRIHAGQDLYSDEAFLNHVIHEFINPLGKFSIETLVSIGEEEIEKKAGEWYSPSDIASVLRRAFENMESLKNPK